MNALIQQVIGEARFDQQAGVIGIVPRRVSAPGQAENNPVQPASHAQEEKREVQLAGAIKVSVKTLRDALIAGGYQQALSDSRIKTALEQIHDSAVELTSMHTN